MAWNQVAGILVVMALIAISASAMPDPGDPGPLAVTRTTYDDGDTAFQPTNFPGPVEVRASVHYPSALSGPYPLVLFLHGRHATCFIGSTASLAWPCPPGRSEIPSYEGYDYIASVLASHGYIVVSIGANGVNAVDNFSADLGMAARAELVHYHLEKWRTWNTAAAAPFGDLFVGKVDLDRVGTMGHSRGGEGVMQHALTNAAEPAPFGLQAVLSLAPTDFLRNVVNNIEIGVVLPYCDGDVSNLQGVRFYDDARYNVPGDVAFKHTFLALGANHNFFNTVWTPGLFPAGASDDGNFTSESTCLGGSALRLTDIEQRGVGLAYTTGFFRRYLGEELEFMSMLVAGPPPPTALGATIYPSVHTPDDPTMRRDVNRLLEAANLSVNSLGGAVSQVGLSPFRLCGGESPQPAQCLPTQSSSRQPHNPSAATNRGLSQLELGWVAISASLVHELPPGQRDVRSFDSLQFRAGLNFVSAANVAGEPQDFSVVLVDGSGASAVVEVSSFSDALSYPRGSGTFSTAPKLLLNSVLLPLSAFVGIDLGDISRIEFRFDRNPTGQIMVTDLAFTDLAEALIFDDGFESGDTTRWSTAMP